MDHLPGILARQFESAAEVTGRLVVAIDGPGCCGKSTLAECIAAETRMAVLETDDFHLPRGAQPEQGSPLPYRRWGEFIAAATQLAAGLPVRFRPIDWDTRSLLPEKIVEPDRVVLIEGIGSLHPDLAEFVDFRIWVDGHAPTRLTRVAQRNSEAVAENWGGYIPFEQAYLEHFRPWRSAHVWVSGAEITLANSRHSFSRMIEEFGAAAV